MIMTNDRYSLKDQVFMEMAKTISKLGTCCRLKVGVVLLRKDGSIASAGYNGSLPGMRHCSPDTCNANQRCLHTSHAEENALAFCSGDIYTAYLTDEPCLTCCRMMARRGVKRIVYDRQYKSIAENERSERYEILKHFGIIYEQIQ